MNTIGARLREERERLRKTQDDFAALAGVGKRALIHYEKGERMPDAALLAAIAAAGADVLYILTGQRSGSAMPAPAPAAPPLARDEEILLDNYRHAPAGVRAGVKTTLETFAPGAGGRKRGKAA